MSKIESMKSMVETLPLKSESSAKGKPWSMATRLVVFLVIIPTLIFGLYIGFFYSTMYVSESNFALRSSDGNEMASLAGMFFQNNSSTTLDAYILQSYVSSQEMLGKVSSQVDILGHYANPARDVYSRLTAHPTTEQLHEYWQWIATAAFNPDQGIISVFVKAYDPQTAKAVNDAILKYSEELVNQINDRAHQDAVRLTREEIYAAELRVIEARSAIQRFRDDKSMLDPAAMAVSLESVVAQLEADAASTQAELNAALEVMHENSPRVQTIQTRLRALQEQIGKERARLAGLSSQDGVLSSLVGDYAQLVTEEKFAQEMLVKSMAAYEAARLKAISQSRYLVPFQPPTLPEESGYPQPLKFTLFAFFSLLMLLGLCSLIIAAIRDHMGV